MNFGAATAEVAEFACIRWNDHGFSACSAVRNRVFSNGMGSDRKLKYLFFL